ncbi:hypothetical protein [Terricaulis sp.]|uniref:hypothetical protein n=1 Tax=Terricaulis sp. TaxID=2768686 RepID=UPI003783943F
MHAQPKPRLSPHRRARLIAWSLAMLLWLRSVLSGGAIMSRRRIRQRGGLFQLDRLARFITNLIIIRAGEIAGNRGPRRRLFRDRGADREPRHLRRSVIGSRLRRALKHRDIDVRLALLIRALRGIEVLAEAFALRMRRRVTRLWPILPGACPAELLRVAPLRTTAASADTS